jgi:hypothetical protein
MPVRSGEARLFPARSVVEGQPLSGWYGAYVGGGAVVQVIAIAPEPAPPDVSAALREIASALELAEPAAGEVHAGR